MRGVSAGGGAFAEYLVVPARVAFPLPDGLKFAEAAMLEAVSVALHGVAVSAMKGGETVLVIGAGMIGLLLVQAAKAGGAAEVLVSDVDPTRLKLAEEMGADAVLLASGAELTGTILERTEGRGGGMWCWRRWALMRRSLRGSTVCGRGGTVTLVGNVTPEVKLPLQKVVSRQIRLQGSCASAGEYPVAMRLMEEGKIKVARLITAVAPLSEGPEWFKRLHEREPGLMKIVLDPSLGERVQ